MKNELIVGIAQNYLKVGYFNPNIKLNSYFLIKT